jgi:HEPN domain-containing protein
LETGGLAPSRFLAIHALELGVKAALAASGDVTRTHNVGGEFGKRFRSHVPQDTARRINRILAQYDGPRYPDWEPPERAAIESDLKFIEQFLARVLPKLIKEARP